MQEKGNEKEKRLSVAMKPAVPVSAIFAVIISAIIAEESQTIWDIVKVAVAVFFPVLFIYAATVAVCDQAEQRGKTKRAVKIWKAIYTICFAAILLFLMSYYGCTAISM